MRFAEDAASFEPNDGIQVIEVNRNEVSSSLIDTWIETNLHDVETYDNADMWRTLARREAESPSIRIYLGLWKGQPATTCSLFQANGMGRIEMVETRTEFRRRGLASAVVARAAHDSAISGDSITYLYTDRDSDAERLYLRLGFVIEGVDIVRRHISAQVASGW
jgi:predicted GNAT family acetyltransferase